MPSPHNLPRTWEDIAKAASEEKDPIRLANLIEELSNALSEKQTKPPKERSIA